MSKKYVFVDIDNTLIDAEFGSERAEGTQIKFADGEKYNVVLRPGALLLLGALRSNGGEVMACTTSTREYAGMMNKTFDFGFKKIYAREDIEECPDLPYRGQCYLIDDKEPWELRGKFELLRQVSKDELRQVVTLVPVKPFWGHPEDGFTGADINNIITKIYGDNNI